MTDINTILEEREGRSNGNNEVKFRCPLSGHDDVHPSASYNLDKKAWYCPVCKAGGGEEKLVRLHQGNGATPVTDKRTSDFPTVSDTYMGRLIKVLFEKEGKPGLI